MTSLDKYFRPGPWALLFLGLFLAAVPLGRAQVVTGEVPDGTERGEAGEGSAATGEGSAGGSAAPGTANEADTGSSSAEAPAASDTVEIPRYEDASGGESGSAMEAEPGGEAVIDAVEIPAQLSGEKKADEEKADEEGEAEEMSSDVALEEEVDEKDSTVKKVEESSSKRAPLTAEALRSKSDPEKRDQVGSSILTRTEARTFTFSIPAPRGQLLGRNGLPLAQSEVAHYAAIRFPFLGSDVSDAEILRYAGERILHVNDILGTDLDLSGKVVVGHYRERRWVPLTFSSVLTDQQVDELTRQKMEGLTLHPVYIRHYPQGETLSHVLGYVGQRPPRTTGPIVNDEPLWGQAVGSEGLEEAFETELRGQSGRVNVLFEADGKKIKEEVLSRPKPGYNVVTSLDLEMQSICEELLKEKINRGAMVVMDVRTGDVMAMASYPQFDPNEFVPSISAEKYKALVEDPAKPLFPRAYRAAYPPASTFKAVAALGFLESGYISSGDVFPCPPNWRVGDVVMRNWNEDHEGYMNVVGALTRSCNTWFYEVAVNSGADSMAYMATRLGLGRKTGIPVNEAQGFVPSNRWWLDEFGYMMSDGEEAVMSIGQGKLEATPLQMARVMAAIGNGRRVVKPRLVRQIQDLDHEIVRSFPVEAANPLNVGDHALRTVRRGLYDVVNAGNGTGTRASHKITVSGKTGTGQWKPAKEQNVAWFAGYFPSKYPVYSFAVLCEGKPGETVSGGKSAAPVVGTFLERYLTEENYNAVRDTANELKEKHGEEDSRERYTSREPVRSIVRGQSRPVEAEEVEPEEPDPRARPEPSRGRGLLQRIFGGGRR